MTVSKKITLIALLAVAISSCSPKGSGPASASEASRDFASTSFATTAPDIPSDYANCTFNGQTIAHGSSINAFQNSTVPYGTYCSAERRTCDNGVLSGSYSYSTCSVAAPASCLFNGQTIAHGASVQAFPNSTVAYNQSCQAETRTCDNGILSGSAAYASCSVNTAASCLFNGQTIAHGSAVQAFANSSVAYGQTCTAETRTCTDGVLSGSSAYASCVVDQPASCLFNGQTVAHGQEVTAFQNSTQAYGTQCVSEQRICANGVMSGSYQYGSCNVDAAKSCLFNGQTVAHGQSVQAFPTSSVDFGSNCISDTRTCNDGVLSGSNQYATCSVNKPASCLFNGQTIAHNQVVQAFATSTVAFGAQCAAEERLCYNGVLDGSNPYASCTVDQPASCLINGLTIAHGQSTILFQSASVPNGQSCVSESRTCNNGSLSGSFTFGSCEPEAAKTCEFNGATIADGASVTGYATGTVPYGETCKSETRTCSNGVLSGSNTFASCSVEDAKSCSFNGQTVLSGSSVKAYASSQVPYGSTCSSETRTCTNGVLSGSNTYASCTVAPKPPEVTPPKSCTFNGKTIASGASVTAYKSSSVGYGQKCESEVRTCTDGVLSGSATAASCVVEGPKSCKILFGLITIPHGFTIWAAAHTTAGGGNRCEAEITLCNNGKFVIDPSLTCQHGNKPPVTIPPPKPGEEQCEIDVKTNNGKHLGVNHDGKHVDSGLHLGWYKGDKPCKPKDQKPPEPPKPNPNDPCEHKDNPKKPCARKKDPKKPCDYNDKHKNQKDKDDCDKKRKK